LTQKPASTGIYRRSLHLSAVFRIHIGLAAEAIPDRGLNLQGS
jgi:hypothetical protein